MAIKIKNSKGEWVVDQKAIETSIIDLNSNFVSNNVEGALRELAEKCGDNGIEYSNTAPIDDNVALWVDTSADKGISSLLTDDILLEFRAMIIDLNSQIDTLKANNIALERRVAYLEQNASSGGSGGSGGGGGGGDVTTEVQLTFEDGSIMTFEDGAIMSFEGSGGDTTTDTQLTFENGNIVTFEDESIMTFEN